jgi:hypothetical protein
MEAQTVVQPPGHTPGAEGPAGDEPPQLWRAALGSPLLVATVVCAVLAALSAALLPTVPSYDPWAWIVWGREVVDPHLSFAVGGGPSWKPLPVIFTTVFGVFGGAAPTLWVIAARTGGLLALVAAFRLARPLAGDGPWGAVAGVLAAAGVVLTQDWAYYMFRGTTEPMLIGTSLWAVDRFLAGRRGSAFVLGVATCLMRPEAWPFLGLYAIWLWVREPRLRVLVLAGVLAIPFFWFVPPWIGSGQPFLAASHARQYNGHLGSDRFLEVLRRGANLQVLPALIGGVAAVALALVSLRRSGRGSWRETAWSWDGLTVGLAVLALVWWVIVVGMTLDGYPGLERFYLPAAALTCVLAGTGIVRVARLAGDALRPLGRAERIRVLWVPAAVTAAVLAASIPFITIRISVARAQEPIAARAVKRFDQLSAAVAAVGGHRAVYPCHSSFAAVNHSAQTALAWKLRVTLGRVGTSMRHQGLMFLGPHDSIDGGAPRIDHRLTERQLLAHVGVWRVYRLTSPGAATRCVGH